MAAPTNAAKREKVLANPEPSTHGTFRTLAHKPMMSVYGGGADVGKMIRASFQSITDLV